MNNVRAVQKLNEQELKACTPPTASWHTDYRHTAFIYIGGLPYTLSEGDIVAIFSQYGEPVYIKLVRDAETGKSKGFCFLKYEDQRSCDLAVDNLGGADVLGRTLRVDHADYKVREGEQILDNTRGEAPDDDTGSDGDEEEKRTRERPVLPEERELMKLEAAHDDDDPMKAYLLDEKRAAVRDAVARWERENRDREGEGARRHRHRSRRDRDDGRAERRRARDGSRSPGRERRDRRRERSASGSRRGEGRSGRERSSPDADARRRRRRRSSDESDRDSDGQRRRRSRSAERRRRH